MSSKGRDDLHRLAEVLNAFEDAIIRREHKKMLESRIPLQQDVDRAHDGVVKLVVELVTEAKMATQ